MLTRRPVPMERVLKPCSSLNPMSYQTAWCFFQPPLLAPVRHDWGEKDATRLKRTDLIDIVRSTLQPPFCLPDPQNICTRPFSAQSLGRSIWSQWLEPLQVRMGCRREPALDSRKNRICSSRSSARLVERDCRRSKSSLDEVSVTRMLYRHTFRCFFSKIKDPQSRINADWRISRPM